MCSDLEEHKKLTRDQILLKTKASLSWMFNDIHICRVDKDNAANVGAMILTVLAMDCFAARRRGFTASNIKKGAGSKSTRDFIQDYLLDVNDQYEVFEKREPYKYLRNLLVHGYSKEGFEFTDDAQEHLLVKEGYLQLHVDSFINDVKTAIENYLSDLENGQEDLEKFRHSYMAHPLIAEGEKGKPLPQYEK